MNARERVLKAFNHEEPDRVPLFVQSIMPLFHMQLEEMWEDDIEDEDVILFPGKDYTMYKKLGFDMSWGAGGLGVSCPGEIRKQYPLPTLESPDEHVSIDGRIHKTTTLDGLPYTWYVKPYLTTEELADEWYERYHSMEWTGNYDSIKMINDQIKACSTKDFVPTCGITSILEPIWEGLGLGLLAKLLRKKKDKVKKYIDYRTKHGVEHSKMAAETDFEVFNLCDDTAFKNNTVINPKVHRELVIPAYRAILEPLLKAGKKVFFHSDGYTEPYFDGLIEAGFHGVESLEPMAGMDLKHLKEKYGDKLCLIGNMDVSQMLPYGTTEEVTNAVKKCIDDAAEGGGYILSPCTDITNSCKLENIQTMIAATKKYGVYKK